LPKEFPLRKSPISIRQTPRRKKKELFGKVRSGQVRVLIGSTQKMGAGTNVQTKLVALHHLDCPWRPSDLQQREGRIIRQGNENPEVDIYTYVTENTFDSYLYQLVESKQKFIGQIMTSKSPVRSAEDIDETALSYAEIKACAPAIRTSRRKWIWTLMCPA
jgi:SNF2 family DNA or RNA helicase